MCMCIYASLHVHAYLGKHAYKGACMCTAYSCKLQLHFFSSSYDDIYIFPFLIFLWNQLVLNFTEAVMSDKLFVIVSSALFMYLSVFNEVLYLYLISH